MFPGVERAEDVVVAGEGFGFLRNLQIEIEPRYGPQIEITSSCVLSFFLFKTSNIC